MKLNLLQQERIINLASPYIDLALECDGLTRVLHTVYVKHNIPHNINVGSVSYKGQIIPFHMWISFGQLTLDYRLHMWLTEEPNYLLPRGLFVAADYPYTHYNGDMVKITALPQSLFDVLVGPYATAKANNPNLIFTNHKKEKTYVD